MSDDNEELSQCCGAPALDEIFEGQAFCADCREHALFEVNEEQ